MINLMYLFFCKGGLMSLLTNELWLVLDSLAYSIAAKLVGVFFQIIDISSKVSLHAETIGHITNRIMILSGVFALFGVAIALVNYIINPDKLNDTGKNGGSIVKNVVIALVLLLTSNTIFGFMSQIQTSIIDNEIIPKLVYGADKYQNENNTWRSPENIRAKKFVNSIFLLFMDGADEKCPSNTNVHCTAYRAVADGTKDILALSASTTYFDYSPIISLIAGIVVAYYFFGYAKEMAIRMLKLIVLQVLAPIPIIMSVIPGNQKRLKEYASLYFGIWASAFVRIITVYLAFVLCSLIVDNDALFAAASLNNVMLNVGAVTKAIIFLGIFHGVKELPELIDKALGTKIAGSNATKGFGGVLGGIIGGGLGLVGGAIAGGMSGGRGGALAGAASGVWNGVAGGAASKNVGAMIKTTVGNVRGQYALGGKVAKADGLTNYMTGTVENFFGAKGKHEKALKAYDDQLKEKNESISEINEIISKSNSKVSSAQSEVSKVNHAESLRTNIDSAIDKAFVEDRYSLEEYMGRNAELQSMKSNYELLKNGEAGYDLESQQYDLNRIAEKEREIKAEWEQQRLQYHDEFFNAGPRTEAQQQAVEALNEFNEYVSLNGMEDRRINSNENMRSDKEEFKKMIKAQEEIIRNENADIDAKRAEIKALEDAKKIIEQQKKDYKNTTAYKRSEAAGGTGKKS